MLKFLIDNKELEKAIEDKYGDNTDSLVADFIEFVRKKQVMDDIQVSIEQISDGRGAEISQVMESIRSKYE